MNELHIIWISIRLLLEQKSIMMNSTDCMRIYIIFNAYELHVQRQYIHTTIILIYVGWMDFEEKWF